MNRKSDVKGSIPFSWNKSIEIFKTDFLLTKKGIYCADKEEKNLSSQ